MTVMKKTLLLQKPRIIVYSAVREGRGLLDVGTGPGLSRPAPLVRQQLRRLREAEPGVEAAENQPELHVPGAGRVRQRQGQGRHQAVRRQEQIHLRGAAAVHGETGGRRRRVQSIA